MERYRILVLGDFHFGESYKTGGARVLADKGYSHSTTHLKEFAKQCDTVVLNLETPLVNTEIVSSPFAGKKPYVHWGDPQNTSEALHGLGVEAVSLANNHTLDYGVEGLESTFRVLSDAGMKWFGAGQTYDEAVAPYRLALPETIGGGEVHFHSSFQNTERYDKEFSFYASDDSPGCARLSVSAVPQARSSGTREDSFQVAFPHWGPNYNWRSTSQYELAHRFLKKDYDLVLGHGGHSMQEVHRKQQRWVVYGIGNGVFNSGGRWKHHEEERGILPFSLWSVLEVQRHRGQRRVKLKLYPVYSNNRATGYQPGPVSTEDFVRMVDVLASRPARPWRFDNPAQSSGKDGLGHFLELDLGKWSHGQKPHRLTGPTKAGDPADWPLRSPNTELEDQFLGKNKSVSTSMLTIPAKAEGGTVHRFGRLRLIDVHGKRLFAYDYLAHESTLGAAIVKDKVLAAKLLEESGTPTPKTLLVSSPDDAVDKASKVFGPVVVKPSDGRKSKGVSTDLKEPEEIRQAYSYARRYGSGVIVQEYIQASEELRVMASDQESLAVNGRALPHVIGDGVSTVRQLVKDKNMQRTLNPSLAGRPIPVDALTRRQLKRQGLSLKSVPSLGETVTVRNVAGLSVGGDTIQALEETPSSIKDAAVAAIAAIPGLGWGGVDIMIERGSGRPYVIEINTQAAYGAALFPAYGQPRDVGAEVWKLRYAATAPEVQTEPQICHQHRKPVNIVTDNIVDKSGICNFGTLFERSIIKQDYSVEWLNKKILRVTGSKHQNLLVTRDGFTSEDKSVVRQVMQKHEWIINCLDLEKIPRARSKEISSTDELKRFIGKTGSSFFLAPQPARWEGPSTNFLPYQDATCHTSVPERAWVQARFRGRRLRILATREKSWVVTANRNQRQVEDDHVLAASRLAVKAVRAIPELRWAAVDVLVRPKYVSEGRPNGILVEGLTIVPKYSLNDHVIAGDYDSFVKAILDSR